MRLAFVVPRYGPDIVGGAEALCRDFAEHLAVAGHDVQVLTTCVRDHMTWRNELRAGTTTHAGVTIHRFPVTRRSEYTTMTVLHARMDAGFPLDDGSQRRWVENTGLSEPMLDAIAKTADHVDALVFLPYLFAPTVYGVGVRPERSLVIPCLHDEPYARFGVVQDALRNARGLIFNSAGERDLALRLIPDLPPHRVVGVGFEPPGRLDPLRWRQERGLNGDVVAYAGRREAAKNFPLLAEWITAYSLGLSSKGPVRLLAMGSGHVTLPPMAKPWIEDVGLLQPNDKLEALGASVATAQLSLNESFSYVVMESWQAGTPVIVHADCAVTRGHCEESNGGLWVRSPEEFAAALDRLRGDAACCTAMAEAGQRYVATHYTWNSVLHRFHEAVETLLA